MLIEYTEHNINENVKVFNLSTQNQTASSSSYFFRPWRHFLLLKIRDYSKDKNHRLYLLMETINFNSPERRINCKKEDCGSLMCVAVFL